MKRNDHDPIAPQSGQMKNLVSTLAAVGGVLAANSGIAAQLGNIEVQSALGESLRASIAYELHAGEELMDHCVSLRLGNPDAHLPALTHAQISVTNNTIVLHGTSPIREPLMTVGVVVDCPFTPYISREYTLFIDPPKDERTRVADLPGSVSESGAGASPYTAVPSGNDRHAAADPIRQGSRYRVHWGDTLSEISERLEDRKISLWSAVDAIFKANPGAFVDSDPNKLMAGSWLVIPELPGYTPASESAPVTKPLDVAYSRDIPVSTDNPATTDTPVTKTELSALHTTTPHSDDLQQTSNASDSPVPHENAEEVVNERSNRGAAWLVVGGIVLVIGLLFGRRSRGRRVSKPVAVESESPAYLDSADRALESDMDYMIDTDYGLIESEGPDDDSTLIDDQLLKAGLIEATDFHADAEAGDSNEMMWGLELPGNDDGSSTTGAAEYPDPEDDQDTIAVDIIHPKSDDDGSTISEIQDHDLLEQDYEDELTATQALNKQLEQAAAALEEECAEFVEPEETTSGHGGDPTLTQLPRVSARQLAPGIPAQNDDVVDCEPDSYRQRKRR